MDLFPQNAGFGSEAAMKEAFDARYLTKQIPLCSIGFGSQPFLFIYLLV